MAESASSESTASPELKAAWDRWNAAPSGSPEEDAAWDAKEEVYTKERKQVREAEEFYDSILFPEQSKEEFVNEQIGAQEAAEEAQKKVEPESEAKEKLDKVKSDVQSTKDAQEKAQADTGDKLEELEDTSGDNVEQSEHSVAFSFGNWIPGDTSGFGKIGGLTHDYLFVGTTKITPPARTTNFLKVYLDGVTAAEWVGAMPATQDFDSVIFDVTKNRIYLSGEFGGG